MESEQILISNHTGFGTVAEPYSSEDFVKSTFHSAEKSAFSPWDYPWGYATHLQLNSQLDHLISFADSNTVKIYDCGVYMGMFAIGAALLCYAQEKDFELHAYEANPSLIEPLKQNFDLYDLPVDLHGVGVGGKAETLKFAHAKGRIIGGTLYDPAGKKRDEGFSEYEVPVVPLNDILPNESAVSIVKLDIEGSEVAALGSIAGQANKEKNIFIVEFTRWQTDAKFKGGVFGEWMLERFHVVQLGRWPHSKKPHLVGSIDELRELTTGKPGNFNTDLCLLPKAGVSHGQAQTLLRA